MKYDRLYNFISPVTGKIADYSQFPFLPEDYIITGNQEGKAEISPILIDIRLNMMDMRYDIDDLQKNKNPDISDAKFIIQIPDTRLPNAQALSDLANGVLGNQNGVIEILQRVSGPLGATDNNIARFDGDTGQLIKDSKVKIDDDGEVYANSLHVTNSTGKNAGFNASSLMLSDVLYSLPTTAGFPTQMLTTPGIQESTGSYQLYWSTPPSQITTGNPYEPNNPYPVFTPIPIPIPITTPFPVPVFVPTPGLPLGPVTPSPVSIDPIKGDIDTPGDIDANDIHGNDASFDGDIDIDGDLSTQGDISAKGNVRGDAFDFEDISELSDDFVRMEAPFDLDHSYQIELPDTEPIMQEQIQPPNQRILQTAWRKVRNESKVNNLLSKNKKVDISLPITKMSWTDMEVEDPITLTFVQATSTTNEKMIIGYNGGGEQNIDIPYAVNLVYGTLNNIDGSFGGFNSAVQHYSIKIKTSYNHKINASKSSIKLFNRYDNGFIIQNETNTEDECIFKIQNIKNNIAEDLLSYNQVSNSFEFSKHLEVITPVLPKHPATKEYVDSIPIEGGVTEIVAGTGLSGGIITTTGIIAIANTGVISGNYRLGNFTVNNQGQLTNVSNSSPSTTTNRAIAVWGNTSGDSLLNTNVTIDTLGNMTSNGTSTFLSQQITNADGIGSLNFLSGTRSLQLRLNSSLSNNILWFLPTANSNGFFKNNGSGIISWNTLSTNDISNFTSDVNTQISNNLGDFTFINSTISTVNANEVITINSGTANTTIGKITINGDQINSTSQNINFNSTNVNFYNATVQFHNGIHVGSTYVSFATADPSTITVFPLGGSLFVDLQSRLCFKDKNGNIAVIVNPN